MQAWKFALWCATIVQSILCLSQKKYRRDITLKNDAKFEEELTCALKNDVRILANFDATLKICTLMGFIWPKCIIFELKQYRGVVRYYTEDQCKLWGKNDLWFHNWHEDFGKFVRSTQKS